MRIHHADKLTLSIVFSLFLVQSSFLTAVFVQTSAFGKVQVANGTENGYFTSINGKSYQTKYITEKDVEEIKNAIGKMDNIGYENVLIDGHGTGLTAPTEKELDLLVGKLSIKRQLRNPSDKAPGVSYDFSNQNYFPAVGDQAAQGSCAAWAVTYYAFGYLEAKDHGWDASSGNSNYLMSPAWTFNKVATSNYGSWMTTNAQIMKDFGCASMTTMPYDDTDYYSWGDESAWREAPYHKIYDYFLTDFDELDPDLTIDAIKSFINSESPVTFAFDAYEYSSGFGDGNYILSSVEYDSLTYNHAQCIVGFDDSIADDGNIGAFKVVNSWGTGFGNNGYYWLTYDCLKEIGYAIGDFCLHLCVLTDRIDYQPDLIATWEFSTAPIRMEEMITLGVGLYDSPLDYYTPWYEYDDIFDLPSFMAYDISDFYSYYTTNNDELFYLAIGTSPTTGTISSFLIERYSGGVLVETTAESINIPQSTPGYVINAFMDIDHEIWTSLEIPEYPRTTETYQINASIQNLGQFSESNVQLYLYLDNSVVNSTTISTFLVGMSATIWYFWTPIIYKTFNFTAYSPLVPGDCIPANNHIESLLTVYKWQNYSMTVGYPYAWIDASSGTELLLEDDDYEEMVLPFEFTYYNRTFTEVYVSSNGYLSFYDTTPDEWVNVLFPSEVSMHSYMIAPFWDDIYPQLGGHIYIEDYTDYWVAQWQDVILSGFLTCSFQVILYESGDIIFNYDYIDGIFSYTCGLNLGIDINYFNSYNGLSDTTDDTSLYFVSPTPPKDFLLTSNAGDPDEDGNFLLTWAASAGAKNYSVYRYSELITEINGSLTPLAEEISELNFAINGYLSGLYYFIVVAYNDHGETFSNCIGETVALPPSTFILTSNADSPDVDGNFVLTWIVSTDASNYSVYGYPGYITEINGSLIPIAEEITELELLFTEYTDGIYYFVVVAHNDQGDTLSNCIEIRVELPRRIPGYNMFILLLTFIGVTIGLMKLKNIGTFRQKLSIYMVF